MTLMKYDFAQDVLYIRMPDKDDDTAISLKDYRNWLLINHEVLCKNHFIKALRSGNKTKFTFDWQSIFATAQRYKYLNKFIDEQVKRTN